MLFPRVILGTFQKCLSLAHSKHKGSIQRRDDAKLLVRSINIVLFQHLPTPAKLSEGNLVTRMISID